MNEIIDIAEKYGQQYVEKLRYNMSLAGRNASGATSDSIEFETTTIGASIKLKVSANSNINFLEIGRNPSSKFPPRDQIEAWIDSRSIIPTGISKDALIFLIQRKIARDGYKGTQGLISDVVGDLNTIDMLMAEIAEVEARHLIKSLVA